LDTGGYRVRVATDSDRARRRETARRDQNYDVGTTETDTNRVGRLVGGAIEGHHDHLITGQPGTKKREGRSWSNDVCKAS